MKITHFRIENFRNIRLAECENPPDFMVICGGNGCGKSAFLNALMTAKEHAASYGGFEFDPRAVSADADLAVISMTLRFSQVEREWVSSKYNEQCSESDTIIIEISREGAAKTRQRSRPTARLLSWYSRAYRQSPGFFDYIDAHRIPLKKQLSTWDASALSDARCKQTLGAIGTAKFALTKEYLASLVMRDAQNMLASHRAGNPQFPDSLCEIRKFFNRFFAPMEFVDVRIDTSPFQYIIRTPRGDVDIDDMSDGEKEVLNTFIRFHQLRHKDAIILFDEADAHLHPDLGRRYLEVLREIGAENQLWLTTHSPEMMIAAGSESLYTVLKEPVTDGGNQFVRVSTSDALHEALSEVMGSRGLVSFNQRIVFIEGEESSTDRHVYEKFYPPARYNVSFVPAGNSATVRKTAERVNTLLSSSIEFQHYFSIVDGDIDRCIEPPAGDRLLQLPVYHVENLLLQEQVLFDVTRAMLGDTCPYDSPHDLVEDLKRLLFADGHINAFARALLDARVAKLAKDAWDAVYAGTAYRNPGCAIPDFTTVKTDVERLMQEAIHDGTWKAKCKGRSLLKCYCGKHGLRYEHFRNSLIDRMEEPPAELRGLMDLILQR